MTFKTVLLAVTAAAALIGAAIIGVPSSADSTSETVQFGVRADQHASPRSH